MRHLILTLFSLALLACSRTAPDSADTNSQAAVQAPSPGQAPGVTEPGISDPVADPAVPETAAPAGPRASVATLALDGEGLRVFNNASGSSSLIAFDLSEAEAMQRMEKVLGGSPAEQGENIDCGATLATWSNGLTTWFSRGRFVGWSAGDMADGVSSAGGLRVGATRQELENGASTVDISDSSLGTEFQSAGIAGLLDSANADAKVTDLWAGATCIAR